MVRRRSGVYIQGTTNRALNHPPQSPFKHAKKTPANTMSHQLNSHSNNTGPRGHVMVSCLDPPNHHPRALFCEPTRFKSKVEKR